MQAGRRIPLTRPETDDAEVRAVAEVLATGLLTQGPKVADFEAHVAGMVGAEHAIATTSATTALHLTLAALGIGPGDDVLVADFTFPATANVVVQQGARPVLVDIDLDTFSMDPADLAERVTPASRAVIPVHPFGVAADMDPLLSFAHSRGLEVVEDAACALGATYRDRWVGPLGKAGCYSFHPRKSITTGEGGMIVTNDATLADQMRLLRSHGGLRRDGRFTFEHAGFNYRLSDILAAIGVAQLEKFEALLQRRRSLALRYRQLLADLDDVQLPGDPSWGRNVFQSFVVLLPESVERDRVIRLLADDGIETTIGTYALHAQPFFMRTYGYAPNDLPKSSAAFRRSLSLPLFPSMTEADQEFVADRLARALAAG
jgi:dTDP-4-amino-4,6-dideoxygalactose transaminase